jgi:hypothetical protein
MKISEITEAPYKGNIGIAEVMRFYQVATAEQKAKFDELMSAGDNRAAWKLIQNVVGVKLQGAEFEKVNEDTARKIQQIVQIMQEKT